MFKNTFRHLIIAHSWQIPGTALIFLLTALCNQALAQVPSEPSSTDSPNVQTSPQPAPGFQLTPTQSPTQSLPSNVPSFQTSPQPAQGFQLAPTQSPGVESSPLPGAGWQPTPTQLPGNQLTPTTTPVSQPTPTQLPGNQLTPTTAPVSQPTPTQLPGNQLTPTTAPVSQPTPTQLPSNQTYPTTPQPVRGQLPPLKPTASKPSKAIPETEYTLGPGDRVRVDVFLVQEYSGEYQVLVDGTVNLPLAGKFEVNGMTLKQMSDAVAKKYAEYLKRPNVTVSLVMARPLKIAVAGEVAKPGSYTVNLQPGQKFPTVTDMVQLAGGVNGSSDIHIVQVRRKINAKEEILTVNLWELIQEGNLSQDISLRDGDSIFIPTKDNIDIGETRQLKDASFGIKTEDVVNVAVVGEVYRPGAHQITRDQNLQTQTPPTLTQAIQTAGGIKPLADVRNVQVKRIAHNGQEKIIDVDLWALLKSGDINEDVILQEGDTVIVPQAKDLDPTEADALATASFAPATIRVNVVGEVKTPGPVDVPSNTPLNQAILAAGGFDERRADQDTVELIRVNPNGTVSKRELDIDLASGINEEKNPALRNNDVVVVGRSGLTSVTDTVGTIFSPIGTVFTIFRLF